MLHVLQKALFFLSLGLLVVATPAVCQAGAKSNVLVLNSYHRGKTFQDNVIEGIETTFRQSGHEYELFIEYMDTKRYTDINKELAALFIEKYSRTKLDALIVSDNNALNFILEHRDQIAPNVPIVFCGINGFQPAMLKGQTNITGVVEKMDYISNLRLLKQILPDTKHVVAVSDCSLTGELMMKELERSMKLGGVRYELTKWLCISEEDVAEKLKTFSPAETVVFPLTYFIMPDRSVLPNDKSYDVFKAAGIPTLTGYDIYVEQGLMGGRVIDGFLHGETAARMALAILGGEKADEIPILDETPVSIKFNYAQMKKVGLPEALLPQGAILVGKPTSFYEENRPLVWGMSGTIVLLATLATMLFVVAYQRNRVNRELHLAKDRFDRVFNAVSDGVWDWDLQTNEVVHSDEYYLMIGYAPDEFEGTFDAWKYRVHPKDRRRVTKYLTRYLNHFAAYGESGGFQAEFRMKTKAGDWKWILSRGGVSEVAPDGAPLRMTGTHIDISEWKKVDPISKD